MNTIFSYVAQCLINNISITEKVPKSIVEFIKSDINNELLGLKKQKQVQIENAKQENDLQRENFTLQQNSNIVFNFNTMRKMEERYDNSLYAKLQQIEQNFLMEKEKLFKNIINQYQYGNRLNKIDFLKLQSHLKNDKQIDELYQMATN